MEVNNIKTENLKISPSNPRIEIGDIEGLKDSIRSQGLLQPLVVLKKDSGEREVIIGGRRLRACKEMGLKEVPCVVIKGDDRKGLELALTSETNSKTLEPLEFANALNILLTEFRHYYPTHESLARAIGVSRSWITRMLGLTKVPEESKKELVSSEQAREGKGISMYHAELLRQYLDTPAEWEEWIDKIKSEGLTVGELRDELEESKRKVEEKSEERQTTLDKRPIFKTVSSEKFFDIRESGRLILAEKVDEGQEIVISSKVRYKVKGCNENNGRYEVELE